MSDDRVQHSKSQTYQAEDLIPDACKDMTLEQVLTLLVTRIVGSPEQLLIHVVNTDRIKVIEFEVPSEDVAQLLGRRGYTVHALRTISKAILGPLVKRFSYQVSIKSDGQDDRR
ncbi:hypothetical protein LCGC14_3069310 [marine sediment metagenome]|uniref:KH domain-containing protein n=1 Tax=marine sediment metagenome TaxID=412755 RepID=A0A0F8X4Y1_9ZZZZ